jgi:hypothetical protein
MRVLPKKDFWWLRKNSDLLGQDGGGGAILQIAMYSSLVIQLLEYG